MASPVLGIDLGTTNSVVAVAEGSKAQVLADAEGNRLVPSVVSFHPQGDVLVGYPARERRLLDARNTIYSIKRLIGRPYRSIEVQRAQERFPFQLRQAPNKGVLVEARGETYTLPEISALVLREVRRIAEVALGLECNRAVITVPANFSELQRSATKAAGKVAGLEVLRILNEPTAAALAYGYGKGSRERIAVYDMGGGTFDVTILELAGDVFEVIATAGDTFLGGDDVDVLIAEKMADAFLAHHRFDPRQDPQAYERLRAAAEWSKCQLSSEEEVHLRVEELAYGEGGVSLDLTFGLARSALESMVRPLIARTFDVCEEAMSIAKMRPTQLDNVILVGGSTRMPIVRAMVAEYFARDPLSTIDPDLVVAQGAALQGWALRGAQPSAPAAAPLGRVAIKRVTQDAMKAQVRRAEIQQEIEAQRPAGPAFAPREQGIFEEPTRVRPAPVPQAGDEGWAGLLEEDTAVRRSPFEPPSSELAPAAASETAAPAAPSPKAIAPQPVPPLPRPVPTPGVVQSRAVAIGQSPERSAERAPVRAPQTPPSQQAAPPPALSSQQAAPPPALSSQQAPALSSQQAIAAPPPPLPSQQAASSFSSQQVPPPPLPSQQVVPPPPLPLQQAVPPAPLPSQQARPPSQPAARKQTAAPPPAPPQRPPSPPRRATQPQAEPAMPSQQASPPPEPALGPLIASPFTASPPMAFPAAAAETDPPAPPVLAAQPAPSRPREPTAPIRYEPLPAAPVLPLAAPVPVLPAAPAPAQRWSPAPSKPPLLLDVTPHSLGVETVGGYCEHVIKRNAAIPVEQTKIFSTGTDMQQTVLVRVVQGESRRLEENQPLGEIELSGLRQALRGQVKIGVTFLMDADGTLGVKARDLDTGREQSIRIQLLGAMSDDEIERMASRQQQMIGR